MKVIIGKNDLISNKIRYTYIIINENNKLVEMIHHFELLF